MHLVGFIIRIHLSLIFKQLINRFNILYICHVPGEDGNIRNMHSQKIRKCQITALMEATMFTSVSW